MSFMDSTVNANLLSSLKITFKSITEYLISKNKWGKSDLLQGTVHWFWDEEILPWLE